MKKRWLVVAVLMVCLFLVAARPAPEVVGIAVGEVHWTRASVCEHPWYPGMFLQYYLTDGCGRELFLHGDMSTDMVGLDAWAEGIMLKNGGCSILEVRSLELCAPPDPDGGELD